MTISEKDDLSFLFFTEKQRIASAWESEKDKLWFHQYYRFLLDTLDRGYSPEIFDALPIDPALYECLALEKRQRH